MGKKRSYVSKGSPKPPVDAENGAASVRSYLINLFDKKDGRAVDWAMMADALFRAAFSALDEIPGDNAKVDALLKLVHDGSYNRIVKNEREGPTKAFGEVNAPPAAEVAPTMRPDFKP